MPQPIDTTSPHEASARERRRALILDWAREGRVRSQTELQRMLAEVGIGVNQGTLSRDIRDLGLLKGPQGYEIPSTAPLASDDATLALYTAARAWVAEAVPAGNLVVVKTPAGGANPLALALDHAGWREVVGTIAGDDTVFIATPGASEARRVAQHLLGLREPRAR